MNNWKSHNSFFTSAISFLVIISVVSLMVMMTCCLHIHVLPDGRVIVHSHASPFQDDGTTGTPHSHTKADFLLFYSIAIIALIFYAIVLSILYNHRTTRFGRLHQKIIHSQYIHSCHPLRAPPLSLA